MAFFCVLSRRNGLLHVFQKNAPLTLMYEGAFFVFSTWPPLLPSWMSEGGLGGGAGAKIFHFSVPEFRGQKRPPFFYLLYLGADFGRGILGPRRAFFFLRPIFLLSCCFFFGCLRVASCRLAPLFFFSPARGAWLRSRNVFCCISRFAALPLAEVLLQRAWSLAHVLLCAAASSFLPRFCSEASSPYSSKVCVVVAA